MPVWRATLLLLLAPPLLAQEAATFAGVVVRRDSSPVAKVRVRLVEFERTISTNDSGRFTFGRLAPGKYELALWPPDQGPVSMEVVLLAGESYDMRIVLADDVQQLQDVTVSAPRPDATARRLEGFERRRARGLGVFLTEEDINRRHPRLLSDALLNINGIRIMERGSGKVAIASRGMAPQAYEGGKTAAPCILRLIVDGMPMQAGSSLDNISPNEVAGIEVYMGSAGMPVELAHYQEDSWCGAIVVWTKGG